MRVALCLLVAFALLAAPSTASRTIYATTKKVERVGDWRIGHHPTFRAAIRAFGQPDRLRQPFGIEHCAATWYRLGLKGDFANLAGEDACDPDDGLAARVTIKGKSANRYGWHTWQGVRVGTSRAALRILHPGAELHRNGWWWIKTGRTNIGGNCPNGCPIAILRAQTRHRRVRAFKMWIGAAGD